MAKRYALTVLPIALGTLLYAQGDTCTNALPIVAGYYHADGPTTGDGGGSYGCGGSGQNGDWYAYTPSFTGTINITSCNGQNESSDDTYVKVMTGSCDSLTCIAWNDDMGSNSCPGYPFATYLDVSVTAGQTYYIVWTSMFNSDDFYWQLGECFATVTGETYRDVNSNGSRDPGEDQMDVVLERNPGGYYHYAGSDPYSFCSDSGSFTLTVPNPPLYHTVTPAAQNYSALTLGTLVNGMDFGFQPIPGIYDGQVNIWGWNPWIGNNTTYHINYSNVGTDTFNGNVSLTLDTLTTFVSSVPVPTTVSGQVITWNITGLAPGDAGAIQVTYHTDSTALTTDMVTATVVLAIDHTEETVADNTDAITANPTTSFDPNEKLVDVTQITTGEIAEGKALEYTIHFQNTGEMPAVNIVLRDMIDSDLDLSTFEMVGATHANQIAFNGNEIVWSFPGIMLPDSSSDLAGSQGGVHFRIQPKSTSLPGTLFENSAGIYFDYNEPVITNTVVTEVSSPESVYELAKANGFTVYPNPGNGDMRLLWASASTTNARIDVIDATGRVLLTRNAQRLIEGQNMPFDLSALSGGNYLVRVSNEQINLTNMVTVRR